MLYKNKDDNIRNSEAHPLRTGGHKDHNHTKALHQKSYYYYYFLWVVLYIIQICLEEKGERIGEGGDIGL